MPTRENISLAIQASFFRFRRIYGYFQWGIGVFNFSALLLLVYDDLPISNYFTYLQFIVLFWSITIPALTIIGRKEWKTVRVNEMKEVWKDHPLHAELDEIKANQRLILRKLGIEET